ncbi:elongation factor 1 alpha-like protein [Clonorchis sinensis]|uniref:Elongation factor 1 alpha-like protein n=1 Tax=Clonorchis sinensis TaxID=79923 RepID=H2KNJ1_CLOSI|nr:elongation factor 1 alpha-like protein [Clonorchis sinensis]
MKKSPFIEAGVLQNQAKELVTATELYLYDASKRKARSLAFFAPSAESLHFSSEDFPANTQGPEGSISPQSSFFLVCSPGDVTGRIRSNGVSTINEEKADNRASTDLELSEPHFDDPVDFMAPGRKWDIIIFGDELKATQEATKVGNKPILSESREPPEVGKLSQALSQKLDVTSQPKERSMSSRGSFVALSTPGTPSKPIDRTPLLTEYLDRRKNTTEKEVINLIVVGHVDAGKSTLMGNMLCQLGNVSGKQLSKYRWEAQKLGKASFAYAWVLDQTAEERTRGVTMDIAQTSFETATKRIALMDAPGHKDFVPRVIGGASQADAALLVVNATNGEFETGFGVGGQTREHARLARLLGVSRLIVAVNKMDTVGWKQERYDAIKTQMNGFLKGLNLPGTIFCPVSGLTGVNLLPAGSAVLGKDSDQAGEERLRSWYDGPCLIDIIDSLPSPDRSIDGPFRFVVSDIFKPAGLGVPAVAGRVISGGVSAGVGLNTSKVFCQPSALSATVKSIRSLCNVRSGSEPVESDSSANLLDQIVKCAFAGDQVALILQGIDPSQSLVPGDVITDPDNPVPLASRIQAKILVFAVPQPITRGYPVIFYYHCTSVSANISKLKSMTHRENKMEKTVKKPRCLLGNCTADVEITLDRPVCLEVYERCKSLGRFMLRVGGESIAGGTVTAVLPPKRNRLIDT